MKIYITFLLTCMFMLTSGCSTGREEEYDRGGVRFRVGTGPQEVQQPVLNSEESQATMTRS